MCRGFLPGQQHSPGLYSSLSKLAISYNDRHNSLYLSDDTGRHFQHHSFYRCLAPERYRVGGS